MDGFTFFKSYYESAHHLSDKDQALFYKCIMDYMFTGKEPDIEGHLMGFWLLIKPNLDTSKKRAKAGTEQNQKQIKTKSKLKQRRSPHLLRIRRRIRIRIRNIKKNIQKKIFLI